MPKLSGNADRPRSNPITNISYSLVQPEQINLPLLDARASCCNSENCIRSFLLLAHSSARSMSGVKASQPMASPKVPPMASQKLIILSMITYRDLLYEKPLAA